jgi:hypothetical protein
MLLILVGMSLSALLAPMVLTQVASTRLDARRVHALNAAQAGLDVALGHVRAATDSAGNGALVRLPCAPLTGRVGAGGTATYEVTVSYFTAAATLMTDCVATGGPPITVPAYARFDSRGSVTSGGSTSIRSLGATYTFQTTNQNLAGGLIHVYRTALGQDLCLDAGSGSPTSGTEVRLQLCDATSAGQRFAYETNLSIALVSAKSQAIPLGMCLDAGTPQVVGASVRLRPCGTPATLPQQQWSIDDSANFRGTSDGINLNSMCFNVRFPNTAGSTIILGGCAGGYDNVHTFSPEASVGAGAAGPDAGQVVNFKQFGRCIDVTEFNVNKGYLIVWPCKQAPDASKVGWNQKWAMPVIDPTSHKGTGWITTDSTSNGVKYCLRSPEATTPGAYVTVEPCPAAAQPGPTWTLNGATGSYATSFVVMDSEGFCLSPTDPDASPADLYGNGQEVSKIVVAVCDGSILQKWNADPNLLQTLALKDVGEK